METKNILENKNIMLDKQLENIFNLLNENSTIFDGRLIKKLGKDCGFKSDDTKVYNLVGFLMENYFKELIDSIIHLNINKMNKIGKILMDFKESYNYSVIKYDKLKRKLTSNFSLTLKEVIEELNKRGIKIEKMQILPISNLKL